MYRSNSKVSGKARHELIALIRREVMAYEQGRAASACMKDISDALRNYDRRQPQNQDGK